VTPHETGLRYDAIAAWWDDQQDESRSGLPCVWRAIALSAGRRAALDVGCGSGGRVIAALVKEGFERVTGIDVSEAMLARAHARHPTARFIHADVCTWTPPEQYDLIIAWDSIFHVPHADQRRVVEKLCDALAPGGALLFTAGGIDGERSGTMEGQTFYYSSLDDGEYLKILSERGCRCVLLERDQHPEDHIVVIGVKSPRPIPSPEPPGRT